MSLFELLPGVHVWSDSNLAPGRTNAGVIVDDDGLTIVDALVSPAMARPFFDAVTALAAPIRRLVLTSSHLPHVGGSGLFVLPAVYGSAQISLHMDQPPNVAGCTALYANTDASISAEDIAELADVPTRAVTHTIGEGAWLSAAAVAAPLRGELEENLIVQVPEARVVFAGAVASFGVVPMAGLGDPAAWISALDTLLEWGEIIVPGHGPIGGEEEVRDLQAYLQACIDADGDAAALASGPWNEWAGRQFNAVNVERAAKLSAGDDSPPPALLRLLGN